MLSYPSDRLSKEEEVVVVLCVVEAVLSGVAGHVQPHPVPRAQDQHEVVPAPAGEVPHLVSTMKKKSTNFQSILEEVSFPTGLLTLRA